MDMFGDNEFLSGGVVLMALGALAAMARNLPMRLFALAKKRLLFTVDIDNTDPAFAWVRLWLSRRAKARYMTIYSGMDDDRPGSSPASPNSRQPRFSLVPRGLCWFQFQGRRILAWFSREQMEMTLAYRETITLQCWRGSTDQILALLAEAHREYTGDVADTVGVAIWNGYRWDTTERKAKRPLASVILQDGLLEDLVADARAFLAARDWYASMGVPWRRGYLLHGPPGNGKTSAVLALAGELGTNINILSLASVSSDSSLIEAMLGVPSGHILLLEDIDAAWDGRERKDSNSGPTFSGLLNAIDGVAARDGRLLVMTTNHFEKLDPALIRPGRADRHVAVHNATAKQAALLFLRFHPDADPRLADAFGAAGAGSSMASLQRVLLAHRGDPAAAVQAVQGEMAAAA